MNNPAMPIAITACSAYSACGAGTNSLYQGLLEGRHQLRPPQRFALDFPTWCGEVDDQLLPALPAALQRYATRNAQLALAAINLREDGLRDALNRAARRYGPQRIGIVIGTSTSGIYETENAYQQLIAQGQLPPSFSLRDRHAWVATAHFLQADLGLQGPCYAISTACSSSSKALAAAQRLIATGVCDAVLCGGVDTLCRLTLHGFNSLEILSPRPSTPLDRDRSGISLGEAAGLLLLERPDPHPDHADAIHLLGCGESSDAHHMTAPHPEGSGAAIAMRAALRQAGLQAADIDYINLHATGTRLNDSSEMRALQQVFERPPHCSGTKGVTGHTLGAAGGIETIIAWLSLKHRFRPGTCGLRQVDPAFRARVVRHSQPDASIRYVMSNNFGFGGNNSSLILGHRHA